MPGVTAGAKLEGSCQRQRQMRAGQSPRMSESFGVSHGLGVFPAVLHKKIRGLSESQSLQLSQGFKSQAGAGRTAGLGQFPFREWLCSLFSCSAEMSASARIRVRAMKGTKPKAAFGLWQEKGCQYTWAGRTQSGFPPLRL